MGLTARIETFDEPLLEETPLERRLRALSWPAPPPGARERGLEALRPRLDALMAGAHGGEPASAAH